MANLLSLPTLVWDKILENLNFNSILNMKSVDPLFEEYIEKHKIIEKRTLVFHRFHGSNDWDIMYMDKILNKNLRTWNLFKNLSKNMLTVDCFSIFDQTLKESFFVNNCYKIRNILFVSDEISTCLEIDHLLVFIKNNNLINVNEIGFYNDIDCFDIIHHHSIKKCLSFPDKELQHHHINELVSLRMCPSPSEHIINNIFNE